MQILMSLSRDMDEDCCNCSHSAKEKKGRENKCSVGCDRLHALGKHHKHQRPLTI